MKLPLLFITFFIFALHYGQNNAEHQFTFNVKKWNREVHNKDGKLKEEKLVINLFDIEGKPIRFLLVPNTITASPTAGIQFYKGKSVDGTKVISLTVMPKTFNGSYLENGKQYFIETVRNKCNSYKIYTQNRNISVGQEEDYVK